MHFFSWRWYAKRFIHPDIVAHYEFIFIWDEDLGVEHFDSEKYVLFPKASSTFLKWLFPGDEDLVFFWQVSGGGEETWFGNLTAWLEPYEGLTWEMTKKRDDTEVDKLGLFIWLKFL